MPRLLFLPLILTLAMFSEGAYADTPGARVTVTASARAVGMGRPVVVTATVRDGGGRPLSGRRVLPYVNGRRWGAHEISDSDGRARFVLPLPRVGKAAICVTAQTPPPAPDDCWIWPSTAQGVPGPVYLQRSFALPEGASGGTLWLAVDDQATVFLNGERVASKGGWHEVAPVRLDAAAFRRGDNLLSVEAVNGTGPAGVLLRLLADTPAGQKLIVSNGEWQGSQTRPAGWPTAALIGGQPVGLFGDSCSGVVTPDPWPTVSLYNRITGTPLPAEVVTSDSVRVQVRRRALTRPPDDPEHLTCMQWEEWFTPANCYWQTAEAVPLMGFYDSSLPDVARQHLIWFIESGVDTILADHSNHIWFSKSWDETGPGTKQLLATSAVMLDEMAAMRAEGYPVPKMTFLGGISHVRPEGPQAANGELKCFWDRFVSNPRYADLWQEFDGKPLVEMLDLGAAYLREGLKLDDRFTVRYVGVNQGVSRTNELGLWTWMDWLKPVPTMTGEVVEAETVSTGCFGGEGWLGKTARGHRNGATFVEDFRVALRDRPRFLHLHQFNEFAGQAEGSGHGADHSLYVDTYSADLNDDIEPTSLTAAAYRSEGGWGYYYLNLTRALVDLYRQERPQTTVLAISDPHSAAPGHSIASEVPAGQVTVRWVYAGRRPRAYALALDGKLLAEHLRGSEATIDLSEVSPGRHMLRLTGEATKARYPLLWEEDAQPRAVLEEAYAEAPVTVVAAPR